MDRIGFPPRDLRTPLTPPEGDEMIEDASPVANRYSARRGQFRNGMEFLRW